MGSRRRQLDPDQTLTTSAGAVGTSTPCDTLTACIQAGVPGVVPGTDLEGQVHPRGWRSAGDLGLYENPEVEPWERTAEDPHELEMAQAQSRTPSSRAKAITMMMIAVFPPLTKIARSRKRRGTVCLSRKALRCPERS